MPNVDSWLISIHCLKCSAKNKATLAQVKRGETIQCAVCGTKIGLKDNDGSIEKQVIQLQEAVDLLEVALKKIRGSLDV
jgi:DNA-directed RNA polymerase subunit RPC12/RpoP